MSGAKNKVVHYGTEGRRGACKNYLGQKAKRTNDPDQVTCWSGVCHRNTCSATSHNVRYGKYQTGFEIPIRIRAGLRPYFSSCIRAKLLIG